jgi:hypothetical protein
MISNNISRKSNSNIIEKTLNNINPKVLAKSGGVLMHAWVVNQDGTIEDPFYNNRIGFMKFNNITQNTTKVYYNYSNEVIETVWEEICKRAFEPWIQKEKYAGPMESICMNAYLRHATIPGSKIYFGHMGWYNDNNILWYI